MFHPAPPPALLGHNQDSAHDMDAEGEHDMDIDPSPSPPTTQQPQQLASRHDQYTSSDAEADGDFEDDDALSLPPSRTAGYTNGSGSTPGREPAVGAAPINFAAVDPALYGLRRSVRASYRCKNLTIPYTHHLHARLLAGTTPRGAIGMHRPRCQLTHLYLPSAPRPQYNGAGSDASDEDEDDFAAPRKAKTGAGGGSKIKGGSRPKGNLSLSLH